MASDQVISARVPQEIFERYGAFVAAEYGTERGARTAAVVEALTAHMAKSAKIERIPTSKKVRTLAPLSQHTKARLAVLDVFDGRGSQFNATSSDLANHVNQSTNNVAKRIQELAAEGYLEPSGEYRQSRDSSKRLMVWKRTAKLHTGGE